LAVAAVPAGVALAIRGLEPVPLADSALQAAPIMMISNFPEAQQASVAAGGVPGFGKNSIFDPATRDRLSQYLAAKAK
ncbi:MAG TPA: hypothetical protein VNT79_15900, partial [Phycisphaerae bacterium]|nr:hypothetical protein [Phycisphaerae bacterium]